MSELCVRVAVRIRPLLPREILHNHKVCLREIPGSSQVMLGSDRLFSFDHTFGPATSQDEVYESCVQPLVETLIGGYNATVFCYGQTGSGKTHTLKGGGMDEEGGLIDRVAQDVFLFLEEKRLSEGVEAVVKVTYMELYREELRDLLEMHPNQKELHIREDKRGNTVVVGAKEMVVTSAEELLSVVETGNALRHTSATGMNEHSSRSHVILTLQLSQSCQNNSFSSKLCLVDLAGSERAAKTGNTGMQLKESININTGLLALGNVIRALSDPCRNRRGSSSNSAHIPYRDAKITRLLRDALGGTAHTLIVACVSPSHHSVAETLSVLQFASKARHIRNRPAAGSTHTESDSSPITWDQREARISELEYEAQMLRELLKEKERVIVLGKESTNAVPEERDNFKQPSPITSDQDEDVNRGEPSQYHLLAREAAGLLADFSGLTNSLSLRQRLQDWQDRLTSVNNQHQADEKDHSEGGDDQADHAAMLKLREELDSSKEALTMEGKLHKQKDAEVRQLQKEVEKLLQERKVYLQALQEEKKRNCIQTEHLVDQQILITHLRSNLAVSTEASSGVSVDAGASRTSHRRPYSVPLIGHHCRYRPISRFHSSPLAYSLERVMAAFKMQSNILLAEIEEKNRVQCVQIEQRKDSKVVDQHEKGDTSVDRTGFRRYLNRTWTSRQWKLASKENTFGEELASNRSLLEQQCQQDTDNKEFYDQESHTKKGRLRDSVTQRQIRDLSVNIQMKEELIKELDKTDKEAQAVDKMGANCVDGGEASILNRLSVQNQQVQAEVLCSLQHMRQQRAQLQASLRQQRQTSVNNTELSHNGEQWAEEDVYKCNHHQGMKQQLHDRSWLEKEEDRVLQRRAGLQELEEELKRREEALLHREACLQQKNKLEIKMLLSGQSLSRDLLHMVERLGSLEEQAQRSNTGSRTGGVTAQEQGERLALKNQRDSLDRQLEDDKVLTAEEEHSLLQLEEAIEALDANLEFKNRSIQDKQKMLLISDLPPGQSQSMDPAQLSDVAKKLEDLPAPEVSQLLATYFNRVVCLREAEHRLCLRCKELELQVGEKELSLKELKMAMQHVILGVDRKRTQQHQKHQNDIQLLLQKLKERTSGEAQQAIQDRLQHLEKELCFYKTSSRQLRKKLKECLYDSSHTHDEPSDTLRHRETHTQIQEGKKEPQTSLDGERKRTHIAESYTKIITEHTDEKTFNNSYVKKHLHQNACHSSPSGYGLHKNTEYNQRHIQLHGDGKEIHPTETEMTPVRLHRRELKQIFPSDQHQACESHSVASGGEFLQEDSIEISRQAHQ